MALPLALIATMLAGGAMMDAFAPIKTWLAQELFNVMPDYIPEYPVIIDLKQKGLIDNDEYISFMRRKGIETTPDAWFHQFSGELFDASSADLGKEEILALKWRGELSPPELNRRLKRLHYKGEDFDALETANRPIYTVEENIRLGRRGLLSWQDVYNNLIKHGYDHREASILPLAYANPLDADIVIRLFRRGIIDRKTLVGYLIENGYTAQQVNMLLTGTEYFPPPPDLIHFAVREVYTPEIVEKYRMGEDLPPKFLEEASKVGLPREQAINYWLSHWELPGVSQGIDMFHRLIPMKKGAEEEVDVVLNGEQYGRVLSKDSLKTLLKTLDIMPYWRDKLESLFYDVPTRVDVRRMYALGVIDANYVRKLYLEIGYSPVDAQFLTDFIVLDAIDEDKKLTKSQIMELYSIGEIDRKKCLEYLYTLNFPPETADYLVDLQDHSDYMKELKELQDVFILLYADGKMTLDKFNDELNRLGLKDTAVIKLRAKAESARRAKEVLPTKDDIIKWYRSAYIKKDVAIGYLKMLNYREEFITLYLR